MATERGLIYDDNMVQAFSTDRADEALDVGRLPGGLGGRENFNDLHAGCLNAEGVAIDRITVTQKAGRSRIPRECLSELCCCPLGGRIPSDIEMHNVSAIVSQDKKHVQDPESYGRDHEEVHGN